MASMGDMCVSHPIILVLLPCNDGDGDYNIFFFVVDWACNLYIFVLAVVSLMLRLPFAFMPYLIVSTLLDHLLSSSIYKKVCSSPFNTIIWKYSLLAALSLLVCGGSNTMSLTISVAGVLTVEHGVESGGEVCACI